MVYLKLRLDPHDCFDWKYIIDHYAYWTHECIRTETLTVALPDEFGDPGPGCKYIDNEQQIKDMHSYNNLIIYDER